MRLLGGGARAGYATSAVVTDGRRRVVGYAGMLLGWGRPVTLRPKLLRRVGPAARKKSPFLSPASTRAEGFLLSEGGFVRGRSGRLSW